MIELHENDYWRALMPLSKVKANHYFALFVLEKQVKGIVYADNSDRPATFYVIHPYGMSLLFGSSENENFNHSLLQYMLNTEGKREKAEWLQAFPRPWNTKINRMLGNRLVKTPIRDNPIKTVEQFTRANFRFDATKFSAFREMLPPAPHPIVPADRQIYEKMEGTVVPRNFWNNADDFCEKGAGFSMIINGEPVCTAYSAYVFEGVLELGIETSPLHRGKGYAMHTCAALITYCLENGYEPVWSCRLENTGSYLLAQKLGFEPTLTLPYYLLPV